MVLERWAAFPQHVAKLYVLIQFPHRLLTGENDPNVLLIVGPESLRALDIIYAAMGFYHLTVAV
jgi:hypothetical protein